MIEKNLILKNNIKSKYLNKKISFRLDNKFKKISSDVVNEIKDPKKTLNILSHKFNLKFKKSDLKNFKRFKVIAIIGMGGSILGIKAIHNFLNDKINKKVYFFDNLNEKQIKKFKDKEKVSKVLFIIISKSGDTIETLSNTFSLNILKKNSKNIILISERKNNFLFNLSKKLNLLYIEHNSYIGGRYSVLSEVGIVPAYLMGINVLKLRSRIFDILKKRNLFFLKQSTTKLANLLNSKKYKNLVFLNYSPELEEFLFWCQQLIAESLGKKDKGFLPIISNAPKDHHSLLQLYLDGPKDKLFYIFNLENKSKILIKANKNIKIRLLNKKRIGVVKNAQKNALIKALRKKDIPFREFKIKKNSEEILGKLFSYFIIETVIIGKLSNINPFDQPAVEQVKVYTKDLLK